MKAIVNSVSPIRYLPMKLLARAWKGVYLSPLAPLRYSANWPEPKLPGPGWVRVRPTLGGICGSDVAMVRLENPPDSFSKAFVSSPHVLGHECVGVVTELGGEVEGVAEGDRVNIEPALSCVPRGIDPVCPACRDGLISSCHNLTDGSLPPGMSIGFNRMTGGSWGESLVAHQSQLIPVPEGLTDEQAVLVDPLACALHAVLANPPADDDTVLVIGAGIVGIGVVSAIRAIGCRARIIVMARHEVQRQLCLACGADEVVMPADLAVGLYAFFGERFRTSVYKGAFGKPILMGGADRVIDCIGSRNTTEDSLRLVRAGGHVAIVGMGHARWVDWDPVTYKQISISGSHGRGFEPSDPDRRHTCALVHEMMLDGRIPTSGLLTHTFPLSDYKHALRTVMNKGGTGCVKAAFRI